MSFARSISTLVFTTVATIPLISYVSSIIWLKYISKLYLNKQQMSSCKTHCCSKLYVDQLLKVLLYTTIPSRMNHPFSQDFDRSLSTIFFFDWHMKIINNFHKFYPKSGPKIPFLCFVNLFSITSWTCDAFVRAVKFTKRFVKTDIFSLLLRFCWFR